jgi:hypothetical protein
MYHGNKYWSNEIWWSKGASASDSRRDAFHASVQAGFARFASGKNRAGLRLAFLQIVYPGFGADRGDFS